MAELFQRFSVRDLYKPEVRASRAAEYFRERDRAIELQNEEDFIRFLRRQPITDTEKKRELAAFFAETQTFSRQEKEKGYNDLLGRERNSRQRG